MKHILTLLFLLGLVFFFTQRTRINLESNNENSNDLANEASLFLTKYNPKLEEVMFNLDRFLVEESKKESDNFFEKLNEKLNVSSDKMYPFLIPDSINNQIFQSLIDDNDVLECRVNLFWEKQIMFGMNNLNDSLDCIHAIYGEDQQKFLDEEVKTSWGIADYCVIKSPNEKRKNIVDLAITTDSFMFFLKKKLRQDDETSFWIELFVKRKN